MPFLRKHVYSCVELLLTLGRRYGNRASADPYLNASASASTPRYEMDSVTKVLFVHPAKLKAIACCRDLYDVYYHAKITLGG